MTSEKKVRQEKKVKSETKVIKDFLERTVKMEKMENMVMMV